MQVRLAFSVAIQVDADILLIDEVLAVGDAAFQQKCFDVFHTMRAEGKTIVFVTHDMGDAAAVLPPGAAARAGLARSTSVRPPRSPIVPRAQLRPSSRSPCRRRRRGQGDGDARVLEVWVEDEQGRRLTAMPQGHRITLRVLVQFMIDVEDPEAGVHIHNEDQKAVLITSSWVQHPQSGRFHAGERRVVLVHLRERPRSRAVQPGDRLGARGSGLKVVDRFERGFTFLVTATGALGGIVDVPTDVTIERADSPGRPGGQTVSVADPVPTSRSGDRSEDPRR